MNWYDYGARMYMPELGRWGVVDVLAEDHFDNSPYSYVRNNPLLYFDPTGMEDSTSNNNNNNNNPPVHDDPSYFKNPLNGVVELFNWLVYGSANKPQKDESDNGKKLITVTVRTDEKKADVNIDDATVIENKSSIPNPDNAPNNKGTSTTIPDDGKESFVLTKYFGKFFINFHGNFRPGEQQFITGDKGDTLIATKMHPGPGWSDMRDANNQEKDSIKTNRIKPAKRTTLSPTVHSLPYVY